MRHSRESMKSFLIDCRAEEARSRTFSAMEENFWDMAEASPFEQTRIITTNEEELADPYLMRVYLSPEREQLERQLRALGVPAPAASLTRYMPRPYLHYFFRGDDDRAFHNHPWKRAFSVILIGGYIEHVWNFELDRSLSRLLLPGNVNYLKRGTYHRAELLPGEKCWTLFTSMGRVQAKDGYDWEFYDPATDEYTPWGEWTSEHASVRDFKDHKAVAKLGDEITVTVPRSLLSVPDLDADPYAGHGGYAWSSLGRS